VNVANDIGEPKGEAEFFGQVERAGILEAENVRAGEADGSRRDSNIRAGGRT